jgi:hypothetical protein
MKSRSIIGWTVVTLVVFYFVGELFVTRVPPRSHTAGAMHMMKRRMLRYASAHNAAPTTLHQLPSIDGYLNDTIDGWRRPIEWKADGDKVTFISLGRDGKSGGVDEDADMVGVFFMKDSNGQWADEFREWEVDPFGRSSVR